jgi:hypothetical protein
VQHYLVVGVGARINMVSWALLVLDILLPHLLLLLLVVVVVVLLGAVL